jgi:hypothetical protein
MPAAFNDFLDFSTDFAHQTQEPTLHARLPLASAGQTPLVPQRIILLARPAGAG